MDVTMQTVTSWFSLASLGSKLIRDLKRKSTNLRESGLPMQFSLRRYKYKIPSNAFRILKMFIVRGETSPWLNQVIHTLVSDLAGVKCTVDQRFLFVLSTTQTGPPYCCIFFLYILVFHTPYTFESHSWMTLPSLRIQKQSRTVSHYWICHLNSVLARSCLLPSSFASQIAHTMSPPFHMISHFLSSCLSF